MSKISEQSLSDQQYKIPRLYCMGKPDTKCRVNYELQFTQSL